MIPKRIQLNEYHEHPYRQTINDLGLKQYDVAHTIGIQQSTLSKQLRGISPMPENVESEIQKILEGLQKPEKKKRKHQKITKPTKA